MYDFEMKVHCPVFIEFTLHHTQRVLRIYECGLERVDGLLRSQKHAGWRQRFEEEHRKLDLNSAGEAKRKRLYKYNLSLKTDCPGEVNRPVLKDNLELWKTVARKIEYFSVRLQPCCFTKVIRRMFLNWICVKD